MKTYQDVNGDISHIIVNVFDVSSRLNLCEPRDELQLSVLSLVHGDSVHPHYHKSVPHRTSENSLEAWIVMRGKLHADLYDSVGRMSGAVELIFGDVLVTISGGHALFVPTEGCIFVECKNGPFIDTKTYFNDV